MKHLLTKIRIFLAQPLDWILFIDGSAGHSIMLFPIFGGEQHN